MCRSQRAFGNSPIESTSIPLLIHLKGLAILKQSFFLFSLFALTGLKSIQEFGFRQPIVVDEQGVTACGQASPRSVDLASSIQSSAVSSTVMVGLHVLELVNEISIERTSNRRSDRPGRPVWISLVRGSGGLSR